MIKTKMARVVRRKKKEGVLCGCGEFLPFSAWVYAHMTIPLIVWCPSCKKGTRILGGLVQP